MSEHLELLVERCPGVRQRPFLVGALIVRLAPGEAAGARDPGGRADVGRYEQGVGRTLACEDTRLRVAERKLARLHSRRRPLRLGAPLATHLTSQWVGQ